MIKRGVIMGFMLTCLLLMSCSVPKLPDEVASSSIGVKLTLKQLVARADWIVVGIVTGLKSQWSADRSQIYTLVTVAVEEWVKGEPRGNEITINILGGQVGEITQRVGGMPSFRLGEKVLVLLELHGDGTTGVVGGWQGKFAIENAKVVGSDLSLAELINQIKAEGNKGSK